jgi:ribosomal protein S18 acetylase RimI-like enzyme
MDNIKINSVFLEDYKSVQLIARETFFETFASSNSDADMQNYLAQSFSDKKVKEELSNEESMFYMALADDVPIGYLKINVGQAQTELQDSQAFHGQRVGQLLFEKALEIAQETNKKSIWLGVWEKNPKAIRFYEKNGFVVFDKHIFRMGEDEQTDVMMRKMLP